MPGIKQIFGRFYFFLTEGVEGLAGESVFGRELFEGAVAIFEFFEDVLALNQLREAFRAAEGCFWCVHAPRYGVGNPSSQLHRGTNPSGCTHT